MKAASFFLTMLFLFAASALPALAQTRTIRHPATGSPAITVVLPNGWSSTIDADNNLILTAAPAATAFSISVVKDDEDHTLDSFAREVLTVANAGSTRADGEDMLPPVMGNRYLAKMDVENRTLDLKMVMVEIEPDWFASATLVSSPTASSEEIAVAEMVLKTIRVLR